MKAFKLASGFAVSALTLAIAGAAVAESTASVEFTGAVKVQTVLDLEAERRSSQLPGGTGYASAGVLGDHNDDWFNLEATWTIQNGPFSGNLVVGYIDENDNTGRAIVKIEDLIVEEGPISFGQVGSIAHTRGKLEGLTDFELAANGGTELQGLETALGDGVGVAAGFRYTLEEFGVRIQGEGSNDTDWGLAASVHQDLDVAEVWADFSYREPVGGDADVDAVTAFGVAVEASPVDLIKIEAAFRSNSSVGADGDSAWAAKLTVNATDDISVFGQVASISTDNENMAVRGGAKAEFAPITVEGWYSMDLTADAEDSGLLFAKVSYSEGAIGAYAETKMGLNDGEGLMFKLGADYTTESGIKYGADYANGSAVSDASEASKVTAFAQYSF